MCPISLIRETFAARKPLFDVLDHLGRAGVGLENWGVCSFDKRVEYLVHVRECMLVVDTNDGLVLIKKVVDCCAFPEEL
jgi:hypothetical protein